MRPIDVEFLIEADQLTKTFGHHTVVDNVSFRVEPGRIFSLIGPSGCGKTTTIRMLTGVYRPTSGTARVFGHDPTRLSPIDREAIGYLPQHFVLYRELSVLDNLGFTAGLFGLVGSRRARRIRDVLDFVELWESRHLAAGQLSGGMQRRLSLAVALLHEPVLLFVDEPTAGIDPVLRAKFWEGFRDLRDRGCTLFLTTQYVTEAEYCDRVAVLREGRLVALGTPNEIRNRAVGGETLEIEAPRLSRQRLDRLSRVEGVERVVHLSPDVAHLIVSDADSALPKIRSASERMGLGVRRLERRQATFDEVFVLLMEREAEQQAEEERSARSEKPKDLVA